MAQTVICAKFLYFIRFTCNFICFINFNHFLEAALRDLMTAMSIFRNTQYFLIEKCLYRDAAKFMDLTGHTKLRNRFAEMYYRLNKQYLKNLDWNLL